MKTIKLKNDEWGLLAQIIYAWEVCDDETRTKKEIEREKLIFEELRSKIK